MIDTPPPCLAAEKLLEELQEKLAPTLARIGMVIHEDQARLKAAEEARRRTQKPRISEES